jgi:deoxyribodipyrimidine photo-lyase
LPVPAERVRALSDHPVRPDRDLVLHWMTSARRTRWNPALERAADLARELGKPLLVLEPLRVGYPYASDRLHAFVLEGMADNARRLGGRAIYHPYVEPAPGAGKGLLEALAGRACAVVGDDFPTFFLPRLLDAAAARLRAMGVRLEVVDATCVVPFRLAGKDYPTAHAFRRHLQRNLPAWLDRLPAEDPLVGLPAPTRVPAVIAARWPAAPLADLDAPARLVAALPVDHRVPAVATRGGPAAAEARLSRWLEEGLPRYAEARNVPDEEGVASGLSPYLHFGHLGAFEVVAAVLRREGWTPPGHGRADGSRAGWWGLSASAEGFLDQVVTWRELGHVTCAERPDHREYGSLPEWARATLARHARDVRPVLYRREALAGAETGDPLWNAAQRQLLAEGTIHNYLRMLWGKKILEWSRTPEEALETMLDLNDRYALDGRDPNSCSGIFWCLGRYDRPWGPRRPIFGTVRYMSSLNTARKVRVKRYLERFGAAAQRTLL